jgi:hypothetical protein
VLCIRAVFHDSAWSLLLQLFTLFARKLVATVTGPDVILDIEDEDIR